MRRSLSGQEREGGMDGAANGAGPNELERKMSFSSHSELHQTCLSIETHAYACAPGTKTDRLNKIGQYKSYFGCMCGGNMAVWTLFGAELDLISSLKLRCSSTESH